MAFCRSNRCFSQSTQIIGEKDTSHLSEIFFQNVSQQSVCYQITIIMNDIFTMPSTKMQILHIYCTSKVMVLSFNWNAKELLRRQERLIQSSHYYPLYHKDAFVIFIGWIKFQFCYQVFLITLSDCFFKCSNAINYPSKLAKITIFQYNIEGSFLGEAKIKIFSCNTMFTFSKSSKTLHFQ